MKTLKSQHWDNPNIVGAISFGTPGLGWVPNSNHKPKPKGKPKGKPKAK